MQTILVVAVIFIPVAIMLVALFWASNKWLKITLAGVSVFAAVLIAIGYVVLLEAPSFLIGKANKEYGEIEGMIESGEMAPGLSLPILVVSNPCLLADEEEDLLWDVCRELDAIRGIAPAQAQAAAAQAVPGVAILPAAPASTPVPEDPKVTAWKQQVLPQLATASGGGTTMFPAGTQCQLTYDGNVFTSDKYWVTCPVLGLQREPVSQELGKQLRDLTGGDGGPFTGSGNWPIVEAAPVQQQDAPVLEESSPAVVVPVAPCPQGKEVPIGTWLHELNNAGPRAVAQSTAIDFLSGGMTGDAANALCSTNSGAWVWASNLAP
jgi:hypothetical protein